MKGDTMTFTILQFKPRANEIEQNMQQIIAGISELESSVILLPAQSLSAVYSPFERSKKSYLIRIQKAQKAIALALKPQQILFFVDWNRDNTLCYFGLSEGKIVYQRRLELNQDPNIIPQKMTYRHLGMDIGLMVQDELSYYTSPVGAQCILLSDSLRFYAESLSERVAALVSANKEAAVPILQANLLGLQENVVYEGSSLIIHDEKIIALGQEMAADRLDFDLDQSDKYLALTLAENSKYSRIFNGLVFGLREYSEILGFARFVLGLSGGVDSALVFALAAEAIGSENLSVFSLPSMYSSQGSLSDSQAMVQNMTGEVNYHTLEIKPLYDAFMQVLDPVLAGKAPDLTEENLQARIRGILLMAESNKTNELMLSTGNKSECAMGYATLYGDMCGGLSVICDLYKTEVYELCDYINTRSLKMYGKEVIPKNILTKAPSAELRPNQKDQDSLPAYEDLDAILNLYLDEERDETQIVAQGFDEEAVSWIIRQLHKMEYKRRQAAPGIVIAKSSFAHNRTLKFF